MATTIPPLGLRAELLAEQGLKLRSNNPQPEPDQEEKADTPKLSQAPEPSTNTNCGQPIHDNRVSSAPHGNVKPGRPPDAPMGLSPALTGRTRRQLPLSTTKLSALSSSVEIGGPPDPRKGRSLALAG